MHAAELVSSSHIKNEKVGHWDSFSVSLTNGGVDVTESFAVQILRITITQKILCQESLCPLTIIEFSDHTLEHMQNLFTRKIHGLDSR